MTDTIPNPTIRFHDYDEIFHVPGVIRRVVLEVLASRRYVQRLSIAGEPLEYVAVVGRKRTG